MIVANTELKLESQPSTLPRAGRTGKSLPLPAAANVPSSQQTDSAAAAGELPGKRRSAAHSYRMQTESSLAKKNASKDSLAEPSSSSRGSLNKKESYTMMRFPSNPEIVSEAQAADGYVGHVKPGFVSDASGSQSLQIDRGFATTKNHSDDANQPNDASDTTLMPPPLSTSVPLSYQATFIKKAVKHRRTTMPESLARSRELLAGAIAKHHRLSDSSADGDDSPLSSSSSSVYRVTASAVQTPDPSPLEPPERDGHKAQIRVGGVQVTNVSVNSMSNAERAVVADLKPKHSDSISSAPSSATGSPKLVKIGRCVSPMRPHSASSTVHKRQLPPDPSTSVSVTCISADHAIPLDSAASLVSPQLSMTRSASAELGIRSSEPSQNTAVSQSASACHLSSISSTAMPVQHMSHMQRGLQPQQNAAKRPIASRTETRLVLDSELNKTENLTCTAQQKIINEIENFCTERRLSTERPTAVEEREVVDPQELAVDAKPLVSPAGHTRQQWEKSRQAEPFILESKSQSNSSVSQTSSSVICDSLADISSSASSVSSVLSSSCLTYSTPAVIGSFSDSVISYGSASQAPMALANYVQEPHVESDETKCNEANENEERSVLTPLRYTSSSGLTLSAISSDK